MKMTQLRRAAPESAAVPEAADVVQRARDVLGYKPTSLHPSATVAPDVCAALADIGLRPFRTEDVERYKRSREGSQAKALAALWVGIIMLAGSAVLGLTLGVVFSEPPWILLAIPGFLVFALGIHVWIETPSFHWLRVLLSSYRADVPAYALETALALKERLPEATFHVDYLTQTPRDPFLLMKCGDDGPDVYLEVWDEPGFGTQRVV